MQTAVSNATIPHHSDSAAITFYRIEETQHSSSYRLRWDDADFYAIITVCAQKHGESVTVHSSAD